MNSIKLKINKKLNDQYVDIDDSNYDTIEFKLTKDDKGFVYDYVKNDENNLCWNDTISNGNTNTFSQPTKLPLINVDFYNNNVKFLNFSVFYGMITFYGVGPDYRFGFGLDDDDELTQVAEECLKITGNKNLINEYMLLKDIGDLKKYSKYELEMLCNLPRRYILKENNTCIDDLFRNENLINMSDKTVLKLLNYLKQNKCKFYKSTHYYVIPHSQLVRDWARENMKMDEDNELYWH